MKIARCLFLLFIASLGDYGDVRASTVAADPSENGSSVFFTTGTMLGWTFTASANGTVTQLGYFDMNENGLEESHEVGIWDLGGALLGSAVISTTDPLLDGFRYISSPAIALVEGHSYVIGGFESGGHDPVRLSGSGNFTTAPEITYGVQRTMYASSFSRPDTTATTFVGGNFGPNFQFVVATVPEPTTVSLFVLALMGVAATRRVR